MILGLDTTTERLHLALVQEDQAWTKAVDVGLGKSASAALMPSLRALMNEAGTKPEELKGVVCCVGPGGFTALRIGVATAEGLALTGLPTWGFSAFRLRTYALRAVGHKGRRWILLDGQRHEAFVQEWEEHPFDHASKLPLSDLPNLVGTKAWWAPEGFRPKVREHLASEPLALRDDVTDTLEALVSLCREMPSHGPDAPLVPYYLRETDAEINFPDASAHLPEALRKGHAR